MPIYQWPAGLLCTWFLVGLPAAAWDNALWLQHPREERKEVRPRSIALLFLAEAVVVCLLFIADGLVEWNHLLLFACSMPLLAGALVWAYAARAREPACQTLAALAGMFWGALAFVAVFMMPGSVALALRDSGYSVIGPESAVVAACCFILIAMAVRPKIPKPTKPWHGPTRVRDVAPGVRLHYPDSEKETADILESAYHEARPCIEAIWGFAPPPKLRLCVLTTPAKLLLLGLVFSSWWQRIAQVMLWPLVYGATVGRWRYTAGCAIQHPACPVAGIKPPCVLEKGDKRVGQHLYVDAEDTRAKLRDATCHELAHAFAAGIWAPGWLNEGVAVWTVDKLLEQQTVRAETLDLLRTFQEHGPKCTYKDLDVAATQFLYRYVRGYWVVRYIEERQPGFLRELLISARDRKLRPKGIEEAIAEQVGMTMKEFQRDIDTVVARYFEEQLPLSDNPPRPAREEAPAP